MELEKKTVSGIVLTLLLASMLTSGFSIQPVEAESPPQPSLGMISCWKFDEDAGTTAFDSVGENDGTIYGATRTTGRVDGALSFDGVDDYVEVLDSTSLDITDEITIETWIKPKEYTYIEWVVSKYKAYHLGLDSDSRINHVRFELQISELSRIYTSSDGTVNLNEWNHIAVTANSTNLFFYIDGVQDEVIIGVNVYGVSDYKLWIGSDEFAETFFEGIIDEVAIYNRALTSDEIQQHYYNGAHTRALGEFSLTAYYVVYNSEVMGTQTFTKTIPDKRLAQTGKITLTLKGSFWFGGRGVAMQGTGRTEAGGLYMKYEGTGGHWVKIGGSRWKTVERRYQDLGITEFTGFGNLALSNPEGAEFSVVGSVIGAAGRDLVPWYSIAAPPGIPLDTSGCMQFLTGETPGGGTWMSFGVDDRGGAIKGKRIDVYVGEGENALSRWYTTGGNREALVYVYEG